VDDLIEGIVRLFERGDADPTNVGNPREFTVLELAKLVLEKSGAKSEIVFEPLPTDDPRQRRPDITRARSLLDWEPKIPLEEGLDRTIEHFRSTLAD
jgi:nucleoside-diphosphate-sugar epimerase